MEDDTLVVVTATLQRWRAMTCAWRCNGSDGRSRSGWTDSHAFTSAEPGVTFPPGPQKWSFMERSRLAYRAGSDGVRPQPCASPRSGPQVTGDSVSAPGVRCVRAATTRAVDDLSDPGRLIRPVTTAGGIDVQPVVGDEVGADRPGSGHPLRRPMSAAAKGSRREPWSATNSTAAQNTLGPAHHR